MLMIHAVMALVCLFPEETKIEIIKNGRVPVGPVKQLRLEHDLRIGPGEEMLPHLLWGGGTVAVDVDEKGNIYVSSGAHQSVFVFDKAGLFKRQIGGPGEGPGEFRALRRLQILVDDGWLAYEKLQAFSAFNFFKDGAFKTRRLFDTAHRRFREVIFSPLGDRYACDEVDIDLKQRELVTYLRYMHLDGRILLEMTVLREPEFDMRRHEDGSYWSEYLAGSFARQVGGEAGHYAFSPKGDLFFAMANAYLVTRYDRDGKARQAFSRTFKPELIRDEEKRAATERAYENLMADLPISYHEIVTRSVVERAHKMAPFPQTKPPINGLRPMENGVVVIHTIDLIDKTALGDVFDDNGRYLCQIRHSWEGLRNMVFRGERAYTLERDDNGDIVMNRYRLVWK